VPRPRRNVLFVTADQWRADCLSAAGHPLLRTPALDALAAGGVRFGRHYANAVPCAPARACLHTGLYQHNHRVVANGTPLDLRFPNWATEARRAGYDPAVIGYTHTAVDPRYVEPDDERLTTDEGLLPGARAALLSGTDCTPWRDWLRTQGYEGLPDRAELTYTLRSTEPVAEGLPRPSRFDAAHSDTAFLVDACLEFMRREAAAAADPAYPGWFLHLSLRAPHPPWIPTAPYHLAYAGADLPAPLRAADAEREAALHPWLSFHLAQPRNRAHADAARHRLLQAAYYALMHEVDAQFARIVDALRASGDWERTLVVFTSDHGEQMGDHWLYGKAGFFEQSYRTPLIVRDPDAAADAGRGRVVDDFSEHVDVLPTLLDWLGIEPPAHHDGRSLRPFLHGAAPANWRTEAHFQYDFRDPVAATAERWFGLDMEHCCLDAIVTGRHKYVHFAALPPLLFDLADDPGETRNLAAEPGNESLLLELAQRLLSFRLRHADRTLARMRITREAGLVIG
jgi:arylsulfatase A-like enzyme